MRPTLSALMLLPVLVLLLQVTGVIYVPAIAMAEFAVLEQVLVAGWRVDETLKAIGVPAAGALAAVLGAVAAVLLGIVGPWKPAVRDADAPIGVELARAPVGLAVAVGLGAMALFGVASAPVFFVLALAASFAVKVPEEPLQPRVALTAVLVATAGSVVFAASMLATPRTGTVWDVATDLLWGPFPWWILAAGLVAGSAAAGRSGMPLLPQLVAWPGRWPWELGRVALLAAACIAVDAADVVRCPDANSEQVTLAAPVPTAFDLDVDDRGYLVLAHRERAVVQSYKLAGAFGAELLHELGPRRGGDLEEVFALPGGRGFLVSEILEDQPKTLLWKLDPVTGDVVEGDFAGMCWVSSLAWREAAGEVLLGCETDNDLWALDVEAWTVRHVGTLEVYDDSEDIALRPDGSSMYLVSLAEGDRLRQVNPETASTIASVPLGGFNYSAVYNADHNRVYVTRFVDSQVLAFDGDTLELVGRKRVGFGVRGAVPVNGGLAVASQFGGPLLVLDWETLDVVRSFRVGGRIKGIAPGPLGAALFVSSTCGTHRIVAP
ncbi:MAG: hypothetical protein GY898_17460 [Proteobacteria bacterium]|nr:hypothetical protein [Pseudomonadota bacterium]